MRNRYRFTDPPGHRRPRRVRLDNIVLLPGDMLPFKETWEKIAGTLPVGTSLIVLPRLQCPQRRIYESVAGRMQALGKSVRLVSAEHVLR